MYIYIKLKAARWQCLPVFCPFSIRCHRTLHMLLWQVCWTDRTPAGGGNCWFCSWGPLPTSLSRCGVDMCLIVNVMTLRGGGDPVIKRDPLFFSASPSLLSAHALVCNAYVQPCRQVMAEPRIKVSRDLFMWLSKISREYELEAFAI